MRPWATSEKGRVGLVSHQPSCRFRDRRGQQAGGLHHRGKGSEGEEVAEGGLQDKAPGVKFSNWLESKEFKDLLEAKVEAQAMAMAEAQVKAQAMALGVEASREEAWGEEGATMAAPKPRIQAWGVEEEDMALVQVVRALEVGAVASEVEQ